MITPQTINFLGAVDVLFARRKRSKTDTLSHLQESRKLFDLFIADGSPNEINLGASSKATLYSLLVAQDQNVLDRHVGDNLLPEDRLELVCKELLEIRSIVMLQVYKTNNMCEYGEEK